MVLDGAPGWDATFDQFGFDIRRSVPEPASITLGLVAIGGLVFVAGKRARNRRRAAA